MVDLAKRETGIFVTIRFWTDFEGKVIPKQAWAAGWMRVRASKVHSIKPRKSVMFNNLEEFMVKLDELLRQHGITLVVSDDDKNYIPRLGKGYPKWTWTGTR